VNPLGHAVTWFDLSRYCHVRLVTSEDGATVEADLKGAVRGRVRAGDVIVSPPLTDAQRALIGEAAAGLVGTPYGFPDIAALALKRLGIRLPGLNHRIERSDRLICSQLVDVVWQSVGFRGFDDGRLPQDVTPGDIADLSLADGWTSHTFTA
jgi:hypothetical protein